MFYDFSDSISFCPSKVHARQPQTRCALTQLAAIDTVCADILHCDCFAFVATTLLPIPAQSLLG